MPRHLICFFGAACLSVLLLRPVSAAEAAIRLIGYSPQEVHDLGLKTQRSQPLSVTGVGQPVYLRSEHEGSYSWSLTAPDGSTSTLSATDMREVYFIPDLEGSYIVTLNYTDTAGLATSDEITITAATYVGVGTIGGAAPAYPQCGLCHSARAQEWSATGHAAMLERGLDGTLSSHYTESCIECHTVGYDTLAVNGGFDDVASEEGWTFPDSLHEGVFDSMVINYPHTAQLANIQCESCHGPGSEHGGNPATIAVSYDASVCAYCHEDGSHHYFPTQWKNSGHGKEFETTEHFNQEGNECVACHTAEGFFEVNVSAEHGSTAAYKTLHGITCTVCHDPHDATGEHQLRAVLDYNSVLAGGTKYESTGEAAHACDVCHHLRPGTFVPGTRPHYSGQTDMLNGTLGYRYPGKVYPTANMHNTVNEERCAGCHMSEASAEKGFVVGGHSFAMEAELVDSITGDTTEVRLTEACSRCHSDIDDDFDYRGIQTRVQELLDAVKSRLVLYTAADVPSYQSYLIGVPRYSQEDVDSGYITETQMKAAYNYNLVYNDRSLGVHNPKLATVLLEDAYESLWLDSDCANCDLNGDGKRTISDVISLLILARDDPENSCLDRNLDGHFSIDDVIALLKRIQNRSCTEFTTQLASAEIWIPAEKMEGLTAEDIEYVKTMIAQMNLTEEEAEAFRIALYDSAGSSVLPKAFSLSQNSPNPFNPATTISYSVPEGNSVHVILEVFDLRGQIVRTLVDETRNAGTYTVFWDGTDNQGRKVASGVFFYRMRAGSFVQTRKMVLLK
ncbi:MAG TPA: FlgD immunoglobulin-like domain containing protein [archaeon]|nr:FlgD immunoglobulin-like domain containing protein [archaeon]